MTGEKRISFFVPSMTIGGAQRVMLNLANEFAKNGYNVDLLLIRCEGKLLNEILEDVRVIELDAERARWSLWPLIQYLHHEQPTSLLSAMTHLNVIALSAKLLSQSSTTIVVSEHSMQSFKETISRKRNLQIAKYLYRYADSVVAVSEGVAKDISQWSGIPRDRIEVIYNPIVTEDMMCDDHAPPNHPWFTEDRSPVILSAGRFVSQKDFPTLIRAFNQLQQEHEVKLVIIGDGEKREDLITLVNDISLNDHISLPGFVDNPYSYMSHADAFVLSSIWEGFGNVLVEAMACGTPVVSTDCPSGPAEILEDGKYGPLVSVGDHESLASAISTTLDTPTAHERLRERARDFSTNNISNKYEKILLV